jgi:hypothetical protein
MIIFATFDLIIFAEIIENIVNEIIIIIVDNIISGLLLPILNVELSFHIPKKGSRNPNVKYLINNNHNSHNNNSHNK